MKLVTITGGSGGYNLLYGIRNLNSEITAIMTAFDDGGSTGRLRKEFGIMAWGDIRRGLLALGKEDERKIILSELTNYRFTKPHMDSHSLGNLILLGMDKLYGRELAMKKAISFYNIPDNRKVMPPTYEIGGIAAELENGEIIHGEVNLDNPSHDHTLRIENMFTEPETKASKDAVDAIMNADFIILGPGDLYTSIIPNLLVNGIKEAIIKSNAKLIYICNLMTKKGETHGMNSSDFLNEIERYSGRKMDYVIVNNNHKEGTKKKDNHIEFVKNDLDDKRLLEADLIGDTIDYHNSDKLANSIKSIIGDI